MTRNERQEMKGINHGRMKVLVYLYNFLFRRSKIRNITCNDIHDRLDDTLWLNNDMKCWKVLIERRDNHGIIEYCIIECHEYWVSVSHLVLLSIVMLGIFLTAICKIY